MSSTTLRLITTLKRVGTFLHLYHPRRLRQSPTQGPMVDGVVAMWHGETLSPADLDLLSSFRTPVVRVAVENKEQVQAVIDAIGTRPIKVVLLVETTNLDIVKVITPICVDNQGVIIGVELGNEIDLTSTTPHEFACFVWAGYRTLRDANYNGDVISGGISRVRPDTLKWLEEAMADPNWPLGVMVGVHRYSIDNDASIPQDGYVDREEECAAIQEVANGRVVAVTEFGYALLDGSSHKDLDLVLKSIQIDCEWFTRLGAKYLFWYQWTDGPTNTPINRYGLKRIDGSFREAINWLKG